MSLVHSEPSGVHVKLGMKVLEWTATIFGGLGALLLAFNFSYSGYGWLAFFFANLVMLVLTYRVGMKGLFTREIIYTGISLVGLYNNQMFPQFIYTI